MGLFDDLLTDSGGQRKPIPEAGMALLDTIAGSESPDYQTVYGGGKFDSFADHPRRAVPIRSGPNAGRTSSAAGRYQFLGSTWDEVKKEAGLTDFSPDSQDQGAWYLADKTYRQKTNGRDLAQDLEIAKTNPQAAQTIGKALSGVWTSLPGGIEPNKATGSFASRYARGGAPANGPTDISAQSRQPAARIGLFDDLIPAAPQEARFTDTAGENFRTAREGVSPAAEPPKSVVDKLVSIWENPPKDKLSLVAMVKQAYESAKGVAEVAAGDVPIQGEDGRTNPEVIKRTTKLAAVAPLAAAPGSFAGAQIAPKVIEHVAPKVAPPTAAAIKEAASAGFESAAVKELEVVPKVLSEFAFNARTMLNNKSASEELAPKTFALLSKLEKTPEGAVVTGQNLKTIRETFGQAAGSIDKQERRAAKIVIDAIDEMIPNIAAKDILSGDAKAAAQAWANARGDYSAAMRLEDVAKAVLKAKRQADAAGSGGNIDNNTRQQFKAILNNDNKMRGFTAEEKAQMESIVAGTTFGNAARLVGKAAPTGIVSGTLSGGAGFAAGGPMGAVVVPLAGYIGKKMGDRSTANQVQKLEEMIRSRAPVAKAMEDVASKFEVVQSAGQNARTMSALSLSARNLAHNLKDAGITLSPTEIMRAIQGPVRSAAEEDQPSR